MGIGKAKVYELIKHGYLPALDLGGLKISDAAIDSFISKYNGHSFKNIDAVTEIAISDQFFGWLCGFRKMAKIVSPPSVVEDFQNFLDDIYGRYDVD